MKELNTIQSLAKVGKVLSNIVAIICIVAFCLCVVGAVGVALGFDAVEIGGITVEGIVEMDGEMTKEMLMAVTIGGAIVCAAEAVLAEFAVHYFKRELADGTPFTRGGAGELQRLGILAIVLPIVAGLISSILFSAMAPEMADSLSMDLEMSGTAAIGVMMIVMAQVCKYGTALEEKRSQTELY